MLQQIVVNTPVWVWPLLAFLIYRGFVASVEREVPLRSVFILPLVMLGLSLQDVLVKFSASGLLSWCMGFMLGLAASWQLFDRSAVVAHPERRALRLRGSWLPLVLMMAIFATKYAVGAALAIQPTLQQQTHFAAAVCVLYGLFSGVFIGQLLRMLAIYRAEVGRNFKLM